MAVRSGSNWRLAANVVLVVWPTLVASSCAANKGGVFGFLPQADAKTPTRSSSSSDNLPTTALTSSPTSANTLQTVYLVLEVKRAEFPIADSRNARKVWNHANRLRINPALSGLLVRNGISVGIASASAWPAIQAIFESAETVVHSDEFAAQPGQPMVVPMGMIEKGESLFLHGREGQLSGRTFGGGEKVIALDYAVRPELGGATDLVARFEIRHDLGVMTWERQVDGATRQVPAVDRHVFEELATSITVKPDEILIVGLSDMASPEHLLGGQFFERQNVVPKREVMLFITPKYIRTQTELRSHS